MQVDFKQIFLQNLGFPPTQDQSILINMLEDFLFLSHSKIFVLKGYAGTGKTTVMSALIKTLPYFAIRSVLLAPTGRAAKVLSLYSKRTAYTIHKKIYYSGHDEDGFVFSLRVNKSKDTLFIIDESSMIGLSNDKGFMARNLLEDLMEYVSSGTDCKVIFIGDTAQLPPVGEIISPALDVEYLERHFSSNIPSCKLTNVVRQALDSGILKNASNIRFRLSRENYSLPIFKTNNLTDVLNISAVDFEEYLRISYKEYGEDETIVVCRSNKQANILNNRIRFQILERENQIDSGDNLMAVKNNYFWLDDSSKIGFIANGDIFKIKRIVDYEEKYDMHFADVVVSFNDYPDQEDVEIKIVLDTLSLDKASMDTNKERDLYNKIFTEQFQLTHNKIQAKKNTYHDPYFNAVQVKFSSCLTCHKAQGGGWKSVFVFQSFFTEDMLDKDYFRWLYTAVTRAKEKLYLVNFSEDFFKD
ncbi:MAG: AAA family ATPase [Bacteroidales bacterium]|nr:AAA family ATPase [Bacteroidales bacterium]MBQ9311501.1 AAA family ATPase [Bacteroidales bacterium]